MRAEDRIPKSGWSSLRLKDHVRPGLRVLFVGINPGVRSAVTGHHFAGYSNRFWKLLHDSRLVPEPIRYEHDQRLPEWGSPKPPMTPEAMLVHYADDLDAKYQMVVSILRDDTNPGPMTSKKNVLFQQLYRGPQ